MPTTANNGKSSTLISDRSERYSQCFWHAHSRLEIEFYVNAIEPPYFPFISFWTAKQQLKARDISEALCAIVVQEYLALFFIRNNRVRTRRIKRLRRNVGHDKDPAAPLYSNLEQRCYCAVTKNGRMVALDFNGSTAMNLHPHCT